MSVNNLEIKGSVKKTKAGDVDAYKGGEGVTGQDGIAWATLADAYAGIPNIGVVGNVDNPPLRLGKIFSVKDGTEVKDYWWNDATKLGDGEEVPYGASGASSFAELEGSPDDNVALAGKFSALQNDINQESTDRINGDAATLATANAYADLVSNDVVRYAGDWDASGGTFPTTGTGTSGGVRRGDAFYISVAGTIAGVDYEVGDEIRAKVPNPGQVASNWGSAQVNTQQATTTRTGIARMATNAEGITALNPLLMSNPVTVKSQIGDEKKNYIKECYVLAVMEIIFPMELAGQFTALSCSTAMSNLQYKIGATGTYTTFSTPVSYSAGAEIYLKWDYTSPTEQRGWLRMKGKDN